jgi:hypothetical protein
MVYQKPWWMPDPREKGSKNEKGQYDYTPIDPDLKPMIHKHANIREHQKGLHTGSHQDMFNWPKNLPKGKNFLVNDTFIRVDNVNYVNIRSSVGKYKPIEINTGIGTHLITTPVCEGYVMTPMPRWLVGAFGSQKMAQRCMNQADLNEAEKDHIFLRNVEHFYQNDENRLWIEMYQKTGDWGDSYGSHRLVAFNRVLHKKREEENLKRHAEGKPYDYVDLINSTFDPDKHTLKGDKPKA